MFVRHPGLLLTKAATQKLSGIDVISDPPQRESDQSPRQEVASTQGEDVEVGGWRNGQLG